MMAEIPTTLRATRAGEALRAVDGLERRLDGEHLPRRPEWDCRTCAQRGTPWPCEPARAALTKAYGENRSGLAMYVGGLLVLAIAEMPTASTADLYERFVAWTR
ncbi:hypothetical protein [Micromonospora sp. DH14]|uniref:hypothetical protein n=1 Tax=Micromonospora sp. DH14 TaxID=3040120 RepID=UPI002441C27A|nr:hypothetical protein [Micromonospora sp. DH14]MDG9673032.1 hypothetical protein [Micromonospora sp. DH14]